MLLLTAEMAETVRNGDTSYAKNNDCGSYASMASKFAPSETSQIEFKSQESSMMITKYFW